MTGIQLGLGLIRIGRKWGHADQEVPTATQARAFLEHAVSGGIRYYDTAPSYGTSEHRLGEFLSSLTPAVRAQLTLATKFGEHWDVDKQEPYVDHSAGALKRSLDRSVKLLGRIDVLQLHKTAPAVLASDDLSEAWEYAKALGVEHIGASVSDLESAEIAIADPRYSVVQLPLNITNREFEAVLDKATERGMFAAVNRPFAMGSMLYADAPANKEQAFRYLLERRFNGVILSGTANTVHLDENIAAFQAARLGL